MKDKALEAVWKSRKSIAQKCGFDSHRLVKFIQQRGKDKQAERLMLGTLLRRDPDHDGITEEKEEI